MDISEDRLTSMWHESVIRGDLAGATYCLTCGIDPNTRMPTNETPIFTSVRLGWTELVRLLASCCDLNSASPFSSSTPLMHASLHGNCKVALILLDAGADISLTDNARWTAACHAANMGHDRLLNILVSREADRNPVESPNAVTSLICAANSGHMACVKSLVSDAQTWELARAILIARMAGNAEVHSYIESYRVARLELSALSASIQSTTPIDGLPVTNSVKRI